MQPVFVKNFTGALETRVATVEAMPDLGINAMVSVSAHFGPLSYQNHLTPAQAREMAHALLKGADEIESASALPAVQTTHVNPPAPFRHMDWQAIEDLKDQSHAN
jgi:hypothetical protein